MALTLEALAAESRRPATELYALPGRIRGTAFGAWATNLDRRHGPGSADAVRAQLGVDRTTLPDNPSADTWIAGGLQASLTDTIATTFYGGNLCALEGPVLEDVNRDVSRVAKLVLRGLGPGRLLTKAPSLHDHSWDIGSLSTTVTSEAAVLTIGGSPLFTYRTWLALQLMALRAALELTGRTLVERSATRIADDRAQLRVRWG